MDAPIFAPILVLFCTDFCTDFKDILVHLLRILACVTTMDYLVISVIVSLVDLICDF